MLVNCLQFVTARKRSLGGGCLVPTEGRGVPGPGGWGLVPGGPGPWGSVWRTPPPEMATAAGGAHPTGMYSCLKLKIHFFAMRQCTLVMSRSFQFEFETYFKLVRGSTGKDCLCYGPWQRTRVETIYLSVFQKSFYIDSVSDHILKNPDLIMNQLEVIWVSCDWPDSSNWPVSLAALATWKFSTSFLWLSPKSLFALCYHW